MAIEFGSNRLGAEPVHTPPPTATVDHVLSYGHNRGPIEIGTVTDEGEVRIGLPEPIAGLFGFET